MPCPQPGTPRSDTEPESPSREHPKSAPISRPAPGRLLVVGLAAVTIGAGIAAYANSFSGPFIFDDASSIPDNPHIRRLWPLWQVMSAPPQSTIAGRPLVCLSLALNYALDGLNVRGYHAFNLAIHLLSALLLSGIVRRTLLNPVFGGRFEQAAPWLAAASATIWMIHPLQTEAVTYIVQRTELLVGFFYLLTSYCAIRAWAGHRPRPWFAAAVVSCALGMASKESMATAPLVVLLYDRAFVSASFSASLRRHWALYAALAMTWLIVGLVVLTGPRNETVGFSLGVNPFDYLRTQAGVIVWYLRLCLWPHPLVISYSDWPLATSIREVRPQALLVLGLLATTAWALWRRPALGFLGAWFFLILAPTSSFVPIVTEFAAERRMYLPLAAVVVLAAIGGYRLLAGASNRLALRTWAPGWIGGGLVIVLATLLGSLTAARNRDYRSELAIWSDAVAKRPRNALAHSTLGAVLRELRRDDEAIAHYTEALRLKPGYAEAHYNMANALADQEKLDQAIEHYREALRLTPDYPEGHSNLGVVLLNQGRLDEARHHFAEAVRLKPDYMEARVNLALALTRLGRTKEAIDQFTQVLRVSPDNAGAHWGLARALASQNRIQEAVGEYREVLRLDPGHADARNELNAILRSKGGTSFP